VYSTAGLITLKFKFGANYAIKVDAAIRDSGGWEAIFASPIFRGSNWTWWFLRSISSFQIIIIDEVSTLLLGLGFSGLFCRLQSVGVRVFVIMFWDLHISAFTNWG